MCLNSHLGGLGFGLGLALSLRHWSGSVPLCHRVCALMSQGLCPYVTGLALYVIGLGVPLRHRTGSVLLRHESGPGPLHHWSGSVPLRHRFGA